MGVEEHRGGNQLVGTFRLRLNNYETGEIQFDASEEQLEEMLNSLVTIRPSKVKVTRTAETSASSQVRAFVWSVTFTSATWHDPTDHSAADEGPVGNWGFDSPAKWGETWESGYSKAWGKFLMPHVSKNKLFTKKKLQLELVLLMFMF